MMPILQMRFNDLPTATSKVGELGFRPRPSDLQIQLFPLCSGISPAALVQLVIRNGALLTSFHN